MPTIVDFVAAANHISRARALRVLEKQFPHTAALLLGIPLSAVTAELPHLEAFLERTLKLAPTQLTSALEANFPALWQTIADLPKVTRGWYDVPNLARTGLTSFDGTPVRTLPQVRECFAGLIAVVRGQQSNFDSLDSTSVTWIAWGVLGIGLVVVVFSLAMIFLRLRGITRRVAVASASVVVLLGITVVALVLALNLIPRLHYGQKLISALKRPSRRPVSKVTGPGSGWCRTSSRPRTRS